MNREELETHHIHVHSFYEATAINPTNHSVQFVNVVDGATESFNYDKLIIATGAHAFNLPIAGNDLDNVATLRHGKQHQLMATVKQANIKNIVVVGAGYIGMMVSDQLSQFGKNVTIIDVNDRPLSTYLDADFTDILNDHMREKQIAFIPNTKVESFSGNVQHQVTAVQTNHGVFDADLVFVSAGTRPNTAWIGDALATNERGYIVTDDYSKTSNKDIFAIGDSTEILYNPTHQRMNISLASNAERQARVAVRNLFEQTKPIHGVHGSSGLQLFGELFASTGLNTLTAGRSGIDVESTYVEQVNAMPGFSKEPAQTVRFKLFYAPKSHKILGAAIMSTANETQQINIISVAIQMEMTLKQLADADLFFQPKLTNLWNVINVAAMRALNN